LKSVACAHCVTFVSEVFKPGSDDDIKLVRKLFVRSSWQVHVPCRLTFEHLATFRTAIPSERDWCGVSQKAQYCPKYFTHCKTRSQAVARI